MPTVTIMVSDPSYVESKQKNTNAELDLTSLDLTHSVW